MNLLKKIFPFLFLIGLVCLLFYKVIFLGQVYYDADNFHLNIPAKYFFVDQILHGIVPLWNPYLFLGIPHLADFNLGTLNPLNIIYFLFPVPRALTVLSIIDIFLLGSFQYIFLRYLKISQITSLLGAVILAFAGVPFIDITNITFINIIIYIPLLFYFLFRFINERKITFFFFLILFQAIQLFAGHPQTTYYTIFFLSFFLLFWSNFSWKQKIVLLLLYYVSTLLLISVQLIPFIEYVLHANRPLSNLDYASWGGLSIPALIPMFFPTFFGTHLDGTWWGPQVIISGYMGVPSLLFLGIGMVKGKIQKKSFFLLSLFLSFFLAIGKFSPVYLLFYYIIPGWRFFRAPSGIMTLFTFFASVLIAIGFEYLLANPDGFKKCCQKILPYTIFISLPFVVLFIYASRKMFFWQSLLTCLFQKLHIHMLSKFLIYDGVKLQTMFQGMLSNGIFFLFFFIFSCYLWVFFSTRKVLVSVLFLLFISITFIYFDTSVLLTTSLSFYDSNKDVPSVLRDAQNGNYRTLSLPVDLHQHREHLAIPDYFYQEGFAKLQEYYPDNNIERYLYDAGGYTSLVPKSYAEFISGKEAQNNVTGITFTDLNQQILNDSSIKYILSHEPITFPFLSLTSLTEKKNNYYIYENKFARKRLYTLDDPIGKNVKITSSQSNKMTALVTAKQDTSLIITNWYYPGWVAYVNGQEEKIASFKNTFQKIAIPKGKSSVVIVYKPLSFIIGLWMSSIGFMMFIVLFFSSKGRKM